MYRNWYVYKFWQQFVWHPSRLMKHRCTCINANRKINKYRVCIVSSLFNTLVLIIPTNLDLFVCKLTIFEVILIWNFIILIYMKLTNQLLITNKGLLVFISFSIPPMPRTYTSYRFNLYEVAKSHTILWGTSHQEMETINCTCKIEIHSWIWI